MEPCNCVRADEIQELRKKVDNHELRIVEIEADKKLQAYQHQELKTILLELKTDMKELKETPSKRWELVITGFLTATIAAIATFVGSKVFK